MDISRWNYLFGAALFLLMRCSGFAHGELHEQIEGVTRQIRQKPDSAELYLQRGELHRLHEDWARAAADFDRAEKLDPKHSAVWLGRARLFLARNEFKDAEKSVERFLQLHPRHSGALEVRAHALFGQKRFTDAAESWRQVMETAPSPDVEHYFRRAQALNAAGSRHTDEALKTLDEGLSKLGSVPTLGLYAVQLEVARKRYDAALERLDRLMPKSGRKETWREMRGDILASAGRESDAQEDYTKALEEVTALAPRLRSVKATSDLEKRLQSKVKRP